MLSDDDFCYMAHRPLLVLEACNSRLMRLVSAGGICGVIWDDSVVYQAKTHEAWIHF